MVIMEKYFDFPLENVAYLDLSHLFSGRRFLYSSVATFLKWQAQQNGRSFFAHHNYGPDHLLSIIGIIDEHYGKFIA